jgi:hypothetical protein
MSMPPPYNLTVFKIKSGCSSTASCALQSIRYYSIVVDAT